MLPPVLIFLPHMSMIKRLLISSTASSRIIAK